MKNLRLIVLMILILQPLLGCSAMLVPESKDPQVKLRQAEALIEGPGRPLPAERLIREAIDIYQDQKNDTGLGEAYRIYGKFFNSPAVEKYEQHYKDKGFGDKTATYDKRHQKALEYLEKSRALLEQTGALESLANVYFLIGMTYHDDLGDIAAGCVAFDKSLKANQALLEKDPKALVSFPKKYSSYKEAISDVKIRMGCKE